MCHFTACSGEGQKQWYLFSPLVKSTCGYDSPVPWVMSFCQSMSSVGILVEIRSHPDFISGLMLKVWVMWIMKWSNGCLFQSFRGEFSCWGETCGTWSGNVSHRSIPNIPWPDGMEVSCVSSSGISNMFHLCGYPGAMVRVTFFPNSSWIENQMEGDGSQASGWLTRWPTRFGFWRWSVNRLCSARVGAKPTLIINLQNVSHFASLYLNARCIQLLNLPPLNLYLWPPVQAVR